jgi:hypothetical protein
MMAWHLGGDTGGYGHTHTYFGIGHSRKAQKEFLAVIRTIGFGEYSVPEYFRNSLPDDSNLQ